ncbi:hypothetical protein ACLMAL_21420 [Nocardia sp. CWNU-33]|uniref:hypothetical protein n=1 Tax=Nocardia sp. CWNU-33 TaxID=3392117 RepID=UPI00398F5BE4
MSRSVAAAVIVTQRVRAAIDDHGSRSDIRAVSAQTQLPLAPVAGSESFYVDLALSTAGRSSTLLTGRRHE